MRVGVRVRVGVRFGVRVRVSARRAQGASGYKVRVRVRVT
jgi:hypothetical protein